MEGVSSQSSAGATGGNVGEEWVAFASSRSGEGDVYAVNPSTGEIILVIGSEEPEGTVRYDAARDRIVYHRYEDEPARAILVASGQDLFIDPNGDVAPQWSPTGEWIAYVAERAGQEDLFIARPDGTGERRLTNDATIDRYPAWSPMGDTIVFTRRLETGWDIFTLDPFTEAPVLARLTMEERYVGHPAWSPDGRYIAFDTLIDGQAEIAMLEQATGTITRLTNRSGNDLVPSWSSTSEHVAFGGEPDNAGNWDVWVVDVTTREVKRLTTDSSYDGGPVFVPSSALGR